MDRVLLGPLVCSLCVGRAVAKTNRMSEGIVRGSAKYRSVCPVGGFFDLTIDERDPCSWVWV